MSEPNVNAIPMARQKGNVKQMVSLAMICAIAFVVMLLSKLLPQVYTFLQLDVKDTVICIGGFVFGPVAAAAVSIIVPLLEMFFARDTRPTRFFMNVPAPPPLCCPALAAASPPFSARGR